MATIKATGRDLKRFFEDDSVWKLDGQDAFYIDEDLYTIDGKQMDSEESFKAYGENYANLADDAKVTAIEGYYGWQGRGDRPRSASEDLASVFKKWLKTQQFRPLVATIDVDVRQTTPEQFKALVEALTNLGAKVSGVTEADLQAAPEEPKRKGPKLR